MSNFDFCELSTVSLFTETSDRLPGFLCARLQFRAVKVYRALVSYLSHIHNPAQSEVSENIGRSK